MSVLILGLNPAWQRVLRLKSAPGNDVIRTHPSLEYASGKGINVGRVLRMQGTACRVLHFLGGEYGQQIKKDLYSIGLMQSEIPTNAPTRCCTTLLWPANGWMELAEAPPAVDPEEWNWMAQKLDYLAEESECVVVSGSFPQGITPAFETALHEMGRHRRVFWDSVDALELLAGTKGLFCVKINSQEFCKLMNKKDLKKSKKEWLNHTNAQHLIVTDGPGKIHYCIDGVWEIFKTPKVDRVINPVGAGDVFMAVLVQNWLENGSIAQGILKAAEAASRKCSTLKPEGAVL